MIDISQEDFGTLCICALRYCHGRQTYMPSLVQEIVQNHFKDLSEKDLKIIAEDERFQREMNLWGSKFDRLDWDNFYFALNEFRQTEPKLCRECEEYAGDGMYCASNHLVYDFDTCKDEPSNSEKPNNCDTCRFELYCTEMCEGCCEWDSHYEPRDKLTGNNLLPFDKGINVPSKDEP